MGQRSEGAQSGELTGVGSGGAGGAWRAVAGLRPEFMAKLNPPYSDVPENIPG